jgi:hypothetical protein
MLLQFKGLDKDFKYYPTMSTSGARSREQSSSATIESSEFQFINADASLVLTKGVDTARLIRRHVMNHHIRQSKLLATTARTNLGHPEPVPPRLAEGIGIGKFKLGSWSRKGRSSKKKVIRTPSASTTSPRLRRAIQLGSLNDLPIHLLPGTYKLLDHCVYDSCLICSIWGSSCPLTFYVKL